MKELFNKTNLPMTVVIALIAWAWLSLITVLIGKLF